MGQGNLGLPQEFIWIKAIKHGTSVMGTSTMDSKARTSLWQEEGKKRKSHISKMLQKYIIEENFVCILN